MDPLPVVVVKQPRTFLFTDADVADEGFLELINNILNNRLKKSDVLNKGWVFEGYPQTASQLHSMQLAGILANKVFVMQADEKLARSRAVDSGVYHDLSTEQFDGLYTDYTRNLSQIVPLFPKQIVRYTDANREDGDIWTDVQAFCRQPPTSKAPRRPMRVAVIGPTGAGKATQCVRFAHRFNVVHISTSSP